MNVNIIVLGRRWFNKSKGQTLHTVHVQVFKNGRMAFDKKSDIHYGYGTGYLQTASNMLDNAKIFKKINTEIPLWAICEDNNWMLTDSVVDVSRKSDL